MLASRPLGFVCSASSPIPGCSRGFGVSAIIVLSLAFLLGTPVIAQAQTGPRPLITQAVDNTKLTILRGNTHPLARAEFDRGPAPATLPMQRMLLVLTRSAPQEAALQTLLQQQQYKASPSYRKWLTPEEFGEQFGASEQDIQTITAWLEAQGFQVAGVSSGRTVIEFSGTAGQVQQAFHTAIHSYVVNGEQHWANASDPQIPSALAPAVAGVDSLNNFVRKAQHHRMGLPARSVAGEQTKAKPELTEQCGSNNEGQILYCNLLAPYDFATIYNVLPLWNASSPIDGTGESIALIGRSNINLQDVASFRSLFGLPANTPQVILDGPDPGITADDDETEADLDVEWSGAVAKGATIKLVVSESTETTDGVDLSAEYAVDNDVAPIISESFGNCELALGTTGNEFYNNLWEQAAAEGISVFVSAGDSGSAGCDENEGSTPQPAEYGLAVNGIASTPYNVSVGGTDFNDVFDESEYWNTTTNNPTTQASAKGYIPETVWNDSCTNPLFAQLGLSTSAEVNCNNSELAGYVVTIGGGGGASSCTAATGTTVSSCAGGYAKPPWQSGDAVPADGKRDVPDVSLFASNGFLNTAYALCEADLPDGEGECTSATNGSVAGIGGTSASTPTFAALLALVDQETGSTQGNPNFVFYKLAGKQTASSCNSSIAPASTCVFNDITSGTNAMPCASESPNCPGNTLYGVLTGYSAGAGYDQATGLGSVNASNLVNDWNSVTFTPSTTTLTLNGGSAVNVVHGSQISVGVSVSPTSPEPTGNVSLMAVQGSSSYDFDALTLANGTASGTTNMLPGGASYTVAAHYGGDVNYGGSNSNNVTVTVTPESSKTNLSLVTFNATTGQVTNPSATTVPYGSAYLLRADVTNSSATDCFANGSTATYACPTGTVALTDNGTALGSSGFGLNSQGNTEDQTIQLTGGTHTLVGNYSGDNSYKASSGSEAVTVTPATTNTSITYTDPPTNVTIGSANDMYMQTITQSNSSGVAPGGTYKVFDGSSQLTAMVNTQGSAGSATQGASLNGSISTTLSAPSGLHTLTVTYTGDSNYASSTSAPITINAVYPTSMTVAASSTNIIYGASITLTATVTTNIPASNSSLKPTGTVAFTAGLTGVINNPVTIEVTQNASGNWIVTATVTVTPVDSETFGASYSGDSNYANSNGNSPDVNVTIPDFSLGVGSTPMAITAGQTGTAPITITPATNDTSTVQLSCGTGVIPGATCSISPRSVTLSNGVAATATLTIATLGPSGTGGAADAVLRTRRGVLLPPGRFEWWSLSALAGFAALLLFIVPGRKRSLHAICGFGTVCLLSFVIGCGGGAANGSGGGGNGGGGGGGTAGPYSTTTTIAASNTKIALGSGVVFTVTVSASNTPTGEVVFGSSDCPSWFIPGVTLENGTAQSQNTVAPVVGTCVLNAQYPGDATDITSTSNPLNIAITGTAQQQITGQTGFDTHSLVVAVTLQ